MAPQLLVDYYHEIWYKINKVGVAEIGRGYKIGDIVELIPNLLDEFHGDTILFEVTDADDGKVISVKPLLVPSQIIAVSYSAKLYKSG